jgi:hypothetical protein
MKGPRFKFVVSGRHAEVNWDNIGDVKPDYRGTREKINLDDEW